MQHFKTVILRLQLTVETAIHMDAICAAGQPLTQF